MRKYLALAFIFVLSPAMPARSALNVAPVLAQSADPQFGRRRNQQTPEEEQRERERVRAMNKERQQKLKEDTDQLLKLATELKQYVDKTNEDILSVEVIKKTDEIEKLAKSVHEKMKTAYDTPQPDMFPRH